MSIFRTHSSTPPVVMNLIIANVVVFLAQMLFGPEMIRFELFNIDFRAGAQEFWNNLVAHGDVDMAQRQFHWWQPFTYMFMHGSITHLFFNMFSLWMFGRALEYEMGWKRFLTYYMVCGVGAALFQIGITQIDLAHLPIGSGIVMPEGKIVSGWAAYMATPMIGASGAVFGLLLAFGMMYPNATISLIFPPISMKAKWFVIVYGVLELLLGVSGSMDSVAHFAHLGGMFWGWLLMLWWRHRDRKRIYYF